MTTEILDRRTTSGSRQHRSVSLLAAAIAIAVTVVVGEVPYSIARTVCSGFAAANMSVANYGYYLQVIRHGRFWNFAEGFSSR